MGMEDFVRRFIRGSLVWLGVGVVLGSAMAVFPNPALLYRPAHMHANLLGFVSMMIFGVAYHVLPRFTGNPLYSRRMARVHLVVANVGLALMVGGWILRAHAVGIGVWGVGLGGVASAAGAFLFITNVWRTLDSARAAAPVPRTPAVPARSEGPITQARRENVVVGS